MTASTPSSSPPGGPRVVADASESSLIDRIRSRTPPAPSWLVVGIGDDAAVLERERNRLEVVTTDTMVEGVHFDRAYFPADAIGYKALAVNLSDLAAMGSEPRAATLSLIVPPSLPIADFDALATSLLALAAACRVALVGGNISRSPGPLVVDVAAFGTVAPRSVLKRAGARPGDELWLTGTAGDAAAGLGALSAGHREGDARYRESIDRFLRPEPRVRMGLIVGRTRAASACIDTSDGLGAGIRQLAEPSGAGAIVEAGSVPISGSARSWFETRGLDPVTSAVAGGEDYELLFAVPPPKRRAFLAASKLSRVPVARIGAFTKDPALILRHEGRDEPVPEGFVHFS